MKLSTFEPYTTSRGERITKSKEHKGLFLIGTPDNKWYSIEASLEYILKNKPRPKKDDKKHKA